MSFTRGAKIGGFPKNGEIRSDVPGRHSRDGWTHREDHASVYIEGKQYRSMREWSRPCVVCGTDILAFEKSGTVDANSRFGNKTCKDHRGLLPAMERGFIAWSVTLRGIVPGPSCVSSDVPAVTDESLRMANKVMTEELDGLYADNKDLKARLAKYELQPALVAEHSGHASNGVLPTKLPWE
jgi:hypothetical protein